ncbi:MAG: hypothetical protein IH945_00830 [Armatimonadetes bacterium]|nr:hypothetical protein [Armatimonadota bacterium]
MSRIIRDQDAGSAFTESLESATSLRQALLKRKPGTLVGRDARREEGRIEGYEIGREQGLSDGREIGRLDAFSRAKKELDTKNLVQIERFAQELDDSIRQFQEQRAEWFEQAEQKLADLAIEIARRAIARELESSRESVVELASQALDEVTDSGKVRLRVNPQDGSVMESRLTELKAAFSNLKDIEVVEDRGVAFGCRLETDAGMIDARVEDFLARIAAEAREDR